MSLRHDSPKETLCKHQTSRHPKTTFAGQLVCPHCQTAFPVSWRRYWDAPWGNYRCPECRQISYATANYWWVSLIVFVAMSMIGIVGALLAAYVFHNVWMGAFLICTAYFIGFPLDKWIDGHLKRLEPMEEKKSASVIVKYFKAIFFFTIVYVFVSACSGLVIFAILSGKFMIYVGYSPDWRTWIGNILGILAGIYAAKVSLDPKPR
jgi:hypothetical protein